MKKRKQELDVDFIGGAGSLTKEEEKAISEFIRADKVRFAKQKIRKGKSTNRQNITKSET